MSEAQAMQPASTPRRRYNRTERAWAALAQPRTVILIILAYCLTHVVVRLGLSPVFSLDEAEQMLFAQDANLGYRFRHPPLITWITWSVQQVFGTDRIVFFLMKYAIMAGGFIAMFMAARAILRDVRLAALATFAFTLTYTIGYYPHVDLMHTVLLTALLMTGLWLLIRVAEHGTWADYLAYGAITALGVLSKYVYGVFPVAALIALLLVPAFRVRIKPLRLAASLAFTAAILAPYAWWAISFDYSMVGLAQSVTGAEAGRSLGAMATSWAIGTGNLAKALVEFTLPMTLIFAALFWRALAPVKAPRAALASDPLKLADWKPLLEVTMIAGALLLLGAVFAVGAEDWKARWMHQVLIPIPIYLFLRLALAGPLPKQRLQIFAGVLATFAALVVGARIISWELNGQSCSRCWEYQPWESYADGLRGAGFENGTILVRDMYVGGNLRAQFPGSRVLMPGYPLSVFPDEAPASAKTGTPGQCLIAWLHPKFDDIPDSLGPLRTALDMEPLPPETIRGRITRGMTKNPQRLVTLTYVLMPDGAGRCR